MKNSFLRNRTLSKWLIFFIDQFIICFSLGISLFVVMQFNFPEILRGYFFIYSALYLLITTVVLIKMRIHTGIIRYANLEDIYKLFGSILISSIVYWFVIDMIVTPYLHAEWREFNLAVILNFFISSSLLVILRIYVRYLFIPVNEDFHQQTEVVLIYGCTESSILVKQALESQRQHKFTILGFIDNDLNKVDKYIQQKKVYSSSYLSVLKAKHQLSKVLICNDQFNYDAKKQLIDKCVNEGIKVSMLPPSDQWLYGKLCLSQIKSLQINDLLQRDPIVLQKNNIIQEITGKRVLVTGAAGSIGSEIVRQLINYRPELIILCDQAESPLHELQLEIAEIFPLTKTIIYLANVQSHYRMHSLFDQYRPQIVFHAAAYKHVPMMEDNPTEAILTNIFGTKNLAAIADSFGVEKFVMISTDKAVNPTNVMGASKRIAEIYIQTLADRVKNDLQNTGRTRFITTRFGNVLGSNGSVVPRFKAQIEQGGPLTVTHPEITRYFMTIPEAVELVLEAAAMGKGSEIFVFDMGKPVKIVDLAKNMIKLAGLEPGQDIEITYTGLRPGEKLYEELLNKAETTIETHHEKIKIAKVVTYSVSSVDALMSDLWKLHEQGNETELVRRMKVFLPEFLSNNSRYEQLDFNIDDMLKAI